MIELIEGWGPIVTTRHHFAPLDGLRGLAALAVMLRHLNEEFRLPQFVGHGYMAVDFFFILSGFVICWAYERRLDTGWSRIKFIQVRLIRLFPLIVLGSVLGGVVMGLQRQPRGLVIEATLLSVLAMPLPWRGLLFPVNSPLWSMCYELASNAAYVFARPRLSTRALVAATAVAAAALIVMGVKIGDIDAGFAVRHGWAGALRLAFPFLAGMLIYRLHVTTASSRFSAPAWGLAVAMAAVMAVPKGSGPSWAAVDLACSLVVLPSLVWFGLRAHVGHRLAGLCALAGELSYPVYVIHKPIEMAVGHLARHWGASGRIIAAAGCVAIILGLSRIAARRYDAPVRQLLTRLAAGGRRLGRKAVLVPYIATGPVRTPEASPARLSESS